MSFTLQLEAFAKKVDRRASAVVRKIVLDVGASIVIKSPVGNPELWAINATAVRYNSEGSDSIKIIKPDGYVGGRFRANWQYKLDSLPQGALYDPDKGPYPDGSVVLEGMAGEVPQDANGHKHYIVNNLAYGPRLENGWSTQAPNGMVSLTVVEFQPIVKAAAEAIQ